MVGIMTKHHICKYCGEWTNIPQLFKGSTQRVWAYIWTNPDCTVKEIHAALFVHNSRTNLAGVLVSQIKRGLVGTDYAIASTLIPTTRFCRPPSRLRIVSSKSETTTDVPPHHTKSVSRLR